MMALAAMMEGRLVPLPKIGKKYARAWHKSAEKLTVHKSADIQ